jgi:hypothetical protein
VLLLLLQLQHPLCLLLLLQLPHWLQKLLWVQQAAEAAVQVPTALAAWAALAAQLLLELSEPHLAAAAAVLHAAVATSVVERHSYWQLPLLLLALPSRLLPIAEMQSLQAAVKVA